MVKVHQAMGTWSKQVDRYIALSEFLRNKLVGFGLPPDKVIVKPNFLQTDPGEGIGRREYALFVGRLVPEKGVRTLLAGWFKLSRPFPLQIAGDGPLRNEVQRAVERSNGNIKWLGQVSNENAMKLAQGAQFLVFPSEWYEGFPITLVESFACGTPVVAARIGSAAEIIGRALTATNFLKWAKLRAAFFLPNTLDGRITAR
jgi:glycosyltransferase involved in cell wall biosynthesis